MAKTISVEKLKLLEDLLVVYRKEVDVIHAIGSLWGKLSDKARDVCAEDFDCAVIARETLLEELSLLDVIDGRPNELRLKLEATDKALLANNKVIKSIYGLDVKSYLNVKSGKKLLKAK